ncbi:MAG TPA: DUF4160 domain-containing protein [Vicinamibacterales bacterium]|jgi:hypothetical protein
MSPTVLQIGRYRFFFFSNEGFEPPHVQDAASLAKFWLAPVELAASTGFASQELTRLRALVVEHREELVEAWHEFFGS